MEFYLNLSEFGYGIQGKEKWLFEEGLDFEDPSNLEKKLYRLYRRVV